MRAWVGKYLVLVGVVHNIVGLSLGNKILWEMVNDGLFNTVEMQYDRNSVFWFLFAGFALMLIGALLDWCERTFRRTPKFFGWSLLALTTVGAFVMPISGFWLLFPPSVALLIRGAN